MKPVQFITGILIVLLTSGVTGVSASKIEASSQIPNFAQVIPVWQQANSNGFGNQQIGEVTALEVFNGDLYAGTYNPIGTTVPYDGAQIFRSSNGTTWTAVTLPGFGNAHDTAPPAILDLAVFNNYLYASTGRGNAAQVWRSQDGVNWGQVVNAGFGDPDIVALTVMVNYGGWLYVGATKQDNEAQIWRTSVGDGNLSNWTQAAAGTTPASITGLAAFDSGDGGLYAAVQSESGAPAEIWRSYGGAWEVIVNDGFGDTDTTSTGGIAEYGGKLYVGAGNAVGGAMLYRTADGTTWESAIPPGFGDPNNQRVEMVFVFQNKLYAGVINTVSGLEIWRTADGTLWEQANQDGFGDSNNSTSNRSNATTGFLNQLYVGTSNLVDGGELWRMLNSNKPPTDIFLSNDKVKENQPVNTVVGVLSAADPDAGATFTFSLTCAVAGVDDGTFNILGTNLRTKAMFDYEKKSTYNICIRVTDQGGLPFDKNFVITVINLIESRKIFRSQAIYDGWVLESGEFTKKGGTKNNSNSIFYVGDNAQDKQYRAILSFGTAVIPDNAVITRVFLKVKRQGVTGTNPFTTHFNLLVDIRTRPFSNNKALQLTDFQNPADMYVAGVFNKKLQPGNWYQVTLKAAARKYVNKKGATQLRLRFGRDDNDDGNADFLRLFSGNHPDIAYRPLLVVDYYLP